MSIQTQFTAQFLRVFGGEARIEGETVIGCAHGWPEEVTYRPTVAAVDVLRAAKPVADADDPERADAAVCRALEEAGALA